MWDGWLNWHHPERTTLKKSRLIRVKVVEAFSD